jgi:hypothetical protein
MDPTTPKNRAQTRRRNRFGPAGSKPKQISGGERKKERKALGYALLDVEKMEILAIGKERVDLRKRIETLATAGWAHEGVTVALWPLGVDGVKEGLSEPKTESSPG